VREGERETVGERERVKMCVVVVVVVVYYSTCVTKESPSLLFKMQAQNTTK
jgi:hypothetical protein